MNVSSAESGQTMHEPPTPEERVKNRTLARAIVRTVQPVNTKDTTDEQLNDDPLCMWLEGIVHDIRIGKL